MGDMLLARAVLSEYHHTHIGSGYQPYAMHDFLKGGTFTDEHGHTAVSHLTLLLYGTEKWNEFVFHKLFGYVIQRTEFHTFHSSMHFGIVGHDDERLHLFFLTHPTQQVYTVAVRQAQVGNYYVIIRCLLQMFLRCR